MQLGTQVNPVSLPVQSYPSDRNKRMTEDVFGERGADYSRQEPQTMSSVSNANELSHKLMAHMLGLEAPSVDPYYMTPFIPQQQLSYPSVGYVNGMHEMNAVVMNGDGSGGNWLQHVPDQYGINHGSYYDFGEYGI